MPTSARTKPTIAAIMYVLLPQVSATSANPATRVALLETFMVISSELIMWPKLAKKSTTLAIAAAATKNGTHNAAMPAKSGAVASIGAVKTTPRKTRLPSSSRTNAPQFCLRDDDAFDIRITICKAWRDLRSYSPCSLRAVVRVRQLMESTSCVLQEGNGDSGIVLKRIQSSFDARKLLMRIAFAYESAYPWFNGGIEKRRFIIMKELAKDRQNDVHMFTMFRKGMPGREFRLDKISYHCVGDATDMEKMYVKGRRRSVTMPIMFSLSLLGRIFHYKFEVVDADSFPFLHLFSLYIYCKLRGARFAVTWHEVWDGKFWNDYLGVFGFVGYSIEWLSARLSDSYIANASTTKGLLVKVLGVDPRKVMVFPAAVDGDEVAKFMRRGRPARRQVRRDKQAGQAQAHRAGHKGDQERQGEARCSREGP